MTHMVYLRYQQQAGSASAEVVAGYDADLNTLKGEGGGGIFSHHYY